MGGGIRCGVRGVFSLPGMRSSLKWSWVLWLDSVVGEAPVLPVCDAKVWSEPGDSGIWVGGSGSILPNSERLTACERRC